MGHPVERLEAPEFLTSSIEVITSIIGDHYICLLHHPIMPDPVLLQGLHIQDSDFSRKHAGNSKQYHFVAPKISSKQQMQVLSVRQRRGPPSDLPSHSLNLHTVM